jgi:hypothetical protein
MASARRRQQVLRCFSATHAEDSTQRTGLVALAVQVKNGIISATHAEDSTQRTPNTLQPAVHLCPIKELSILPQQAVQSVPYALSASDATAAAVYNP